MNQISKFTISAFAVLGAFLMMSTAFVQPLTSTFVQPVTMKNSMQLITTGNEDIGDYLKQLVEDDDLRHLINLIDLYHDVEDIKISFLRELASTMQQKTAFQQLTDLVASVYSNEFNVLSTRTDDVDKKDTLPDHLDGSELEINKLSDFTFKEQKGKVVFKNSLLSKLFEKISYKRPLLSSVLNKLFNCENQDKKIGTLDGDSVALYYKGERKPIITAPLSTINTFLLVMEILIKDYYHMKYPYPDDGFNLDDYCTRFNLAADIKKDKSIRNKILAIGSDPDLNIVERLENLWNFNEEERNDMINSIIEDIQSHELYQDISDIITSKSEDAGVAEPLISPISIPIFIIMELIAIGSLTAGFYLLFWTYISIIIFGGLFTPEAYIDLIIGVFLTAFGLFMAVSGVIVLIFF